MNKLGINHKSDASSERKHRPSFITSMPFPDGWQLPDHTEQQELDGYRINTTNLGSRTEE